MIDTLLKRLNREVDPTAVLTYLVRVGLASTFLIFAVHYIGTRTTATLGFIGASILVLELAILPRRWIRAVTWMGSARMWMRSHIWLGVLSIPVVYYHAGSSWGGALTFLLMILFTVVVASGIVGLVLQSVLPKTLLTLAPDQSYFADIECRAKTLAARAQQRMVAHGILGPSIEHTQPGRREAATYLQVTFRQTIEPYLIHGARSRSALKHEYRSSAVFELMHDQAGDLFGELISFWEEACEQRRQLDMQIRIRWWLHSWKVIHTPISFCIAVLLVIHILDVIPDLIQ